MRQGITGNDNFLEVPVMVPLTTDLRLVALAQEHVNIVSAELEKQK